MGVERRCAVDGVDQTDDAVESESLGEDRMPHHRLKHGYRIGKAGRFDDDTLQRGDAARLHPVD